MPVNQRFRPPLTPGGGEARGRETPGGTEAIPGEENAPSLPLPIRTGPPKLLNHPNPIEIVQIPRQGLHVSRGATICAHHLGGRAFTSQKIPTPVVGVRGWQVGGDHSLSKRLGFNDSSGSHPYGESAEPEQTHLTERYGGES